MKLVRYDPKFKFPVFIHNVGERIQSMSIRDARKLYEELGEVLEMEEMRLDDKKQQDSLYIGAKIITACPMDELTFFKKYTNQNIEDQENRAGYKVAYPDNYVSWSPKAVFEVAYRKVTFGELALMSD